MFGSDMNELSIRHTQRLSLTALEERCVPATTAWVSSGTLHIIGDDGDQNIVVLHNGGSNDSVRGLTGYSAEDPPKFDGVMTINISTKGGSDKVELFSNAPKADLFTVEVKGDGQLDVINHHLNITGSFTVTDTSKQNVSVTLRRGTEIGKKFTVTSGNGEDLVRAEEGVIIGDAVLLRLGNGKNTTYLELTTIDGNLTVNGGTGDDTVRLEFVEIGMLKQGSMGLVLDRGSNTVIMKSTKVSHNGSITCSEGALDLKITGSTVRGSFDVNAKSINAEIASGSKFWSRLKLASGAGPDVLKIQDCTINGDFSALTGAGTNTDTVTVVKTTVCGNGAIKGAGLKEITVRDSTFWRNLEIYTLQPQGATPSSLAILLELRTIKGTLGIITGDANDTVTLRTVDIYELGRGIASSIQVGGGNDTVDLGSSVFHGNAWFHGGPGWDTLIAGDATFLGDVIAYEFNISDRQF